MRNGTFVQNSTSKLDQVSPCSRIDTPTSPDTDIAVTVSDLTTVSMDITVIISAISITTAVAVAVVPSTATVRYATLPVSTTTMKCTIVVIGELKAAFIDRFALANTISTIVIANAATDGLAGATDRCAVVVVAIVVVAIVMVAIVITRDREVAATADRTIDREVTIDPDPTNATTTDPVPTSDTIAVLSIAITMITTDAITMITTDAITITTDAITITTDAVAITTDAVAIAAVRRPKAVRTKKFTVAKETDRNRFHTVIRRTYRT